MGLKLEIKISQSSENHSITDFPQISVIYNGDDTIQNDIDPRSSSVKERLDAIEKENPPRFAFLWTPPDKHKSVFFSLKKKGKKELSQISFRIWIKDGDQNLWHANALAEGCEIEQADVRSSAQVVAIKCSKFTYKEHRY